MRRMVAYFPSLILVSLFFWPNIMDQVVSYSFPCFRIMGFSIRITEIYFFILFGYTIFLLLNTKRSKGPSLIFSKEIRAVYPYLLLGIMILVFATIQGYMNKNPIILLDWRGIFYAVFVVVFTFSIRSIEQFRKPFKVFYVGLVIISMSNILISVFKFSSTSGCYSNLTVMTSLYLLCLSISFSVYFLQYRRQFSWIALVSLISCILSMQKQAFLGCLASLIFGLLLVNKNKRGKLIKLLFVFALAMVLSVVVAFKMDLFELNYNTSFDDYYRNRILRENAGGDFSGGRFGMWAQIIADAIDNPLIGKGMGVEGFHFETIEIPVHEHNIIMWALRRFSIIGTLVFILLSIKFFTFSRSVYKNETSLFKLALLHSSLTYGLVFLSVNLVMLLPFVFEPAIIFWLNGSIVLIIYREQLIDKQAIQLFEN